MICQDNEKVGKWVIEKAGGVWDSTKKAIGIEKNGNLVVGVIYYDYMGENGSISIGWRCENPIYNSKIFLNIAFDYPFNVAKAKRLVGIVNSSNIKAQIANEKLGFTKEAVLENYFPDGDAIVYRMYRHECRWIRK